MHARPGTILATRIATRPDGGCLYCLLTSRCVTAYRCRLPRPTRLRLDLLQPVLGWNGFDDHAWSISSWNCCTSGNANYSTPQGTATGDEIVGTVSGNCAVGSMCSTWNIATVDKTNGHTSTLEQTSSYGQRFDWAFAGVVEVYGVSACDQYSSNGFVDFTAVSLLDLENKPLSRPGWTASGLMQDNAPPCDYGVTIAPTSASLSF